MLRFPCPTPSPLGPRRHENCVMPRGSNKYFPRELLERLARYMLHDGAGQKRAERRIHVPFTWGVLHRHRVRKRNPCGTRVEPILVAPALGVVIIRVEPRPHRQEVTNPDPPLCGRHPRGQQAGDRLVHSGNEAPLNRDADQRGGDALRGGANIAHGLRTVAVEVALDFEAPVACDDDATQISRRIALQVVEELLRACSIERLAGDRRAARARGLSSRPMA